MYDVMYMSFLVINSLSYHFCVAFFFLLNNCYWSVLSVTIHQAESQVYWGENEFEIKKNVVTIILY